MSTALERREELVVAAAREYGRGDACKGKNGEKMCVEISKIAFFFFFFGILTLEAFRFCKTG